MTLPRNVVVGVCTFRRETITATLQSLNRLALPSGVRLAVCVADNDGTPSARARVEEAAAALSINVTYLHAPQGNISIARNAVLDHATATGTRWLAFIDDDEVADEAWLDALLARAEESRCSAVVGPVKARYGLGAPEWMRQGAVHDTQPDVDARGMAHTGYTCNLLLDLEDPKIAGLRFDPERGRSGGEDTAFIAAYQRAGGQIAYTARAIVREIVPADRARLGWLLRRRFRMGQTHGQLIHREKRVPGRLVQFLLAGMKCSYCLGVAALRITDPLARNRALMRGALHAGVMAGDLGLRPLQLYGFERSKAGGNV